MPLIARNVCSLVLASSLICLFTRDTSAQDQAACVQSANKVVVLRRDKKLVEAKKELAICAQESCDEVVRDDCKTWLAEVDAQLPSVVFSAKDGAGNDLVEVEVSSDGRVLTKRLDGTTLSLDPGQYVFRFVAPRQPPQEKSVVIAEGQKSRAIDIVFAEADNPAPPNQNTTSANLVVPAWITLGVGAGGLVAFGVLQGIGQSEYSDLEDTCGTTHSCTDEQIDPVQTKLVASIPLLGVGAAGVVTATVLFIVDATSDAPEKAARPTVDLQWGSDFAFATITFPL
ncbi:MAG: hypothetical protein HOW73_33330 [Polyangiaceae bacterium]|nr:hypothetical protein [Polyangiaceae bacterium]